MFCRLNLSKRSSNGKHITEQVDFSGISNITFNQHIEHGREHRNQNCNTSRRAIFYNRAFSKMKVYSEVLIILKIVRPDEGLSKLDTVDSAFFGKPRDACGVIARNDCRFDGKRHPTVVSAYRKCFREARNVLLDEIASRNWLGSKRFRHIVCFDANPLSGLSFIEQVVNDLFNCFFDVSNPKRRTVVF